MKPLRGSAIPTCGGSGLVLALCLAALAGRARAAEPAQPEAMAVLGLETADLPEEIGARVTAGLRRALKRRDGVEAMPGKDLMEMRFLFGCTEEENLGPCLSQAGRSLVVNRLIFGSLREATIGDKKTGAYFVRLRVLDVSSGVIAAVELHETVGPDQIADPRLDDTADRWLAVLIGGQAPRAAPVVAVTDKPVEASHPGRRILIAGIVITAVAVVALGASIYTWRKYEDAQGPANASLTQLALSNRAYYDANKGYFTGQPGCTLPASAPSDPSASSFSSQCSSGQSNATATSALLATGVVLGAVGVTGIALGVVASHRGQSGDAAPPPKSTRLGPSLAPTADGFALTF